MNYAVVAVNIIFKRYFLKILCKMLKMTNNHLRMISLSNWTEITDRDGPLQLYFNRELPEPFSREKIPQASIVVSRTWKLRFTSNSISRSWTGLKWTPAVECWHCRCHTDSEGMLMILTFALTCVTPSSVTVLSIVQSYSIYSSNWKLLSDQLGSQGSC